MRNLLNLLLIYMVVLSTVGCAEEDAGSAATISNLSYTPQVVTVGQATAVDSPFDFVGATGGLEAVRATLRAGTESIDTADTPIAGAGTATDGQVAKYTIDLAVPTAGQAEVDVWIVDNSGRESNKLTATITAQ
ncbi:MAG: hypothetical protein ACI9OJ_003037 [Myxococcota bacterium]|jgi:hypothetical protein